MDRLDRSVSNLLGIIKEKDQQIEGLKCLVVLILAAVMMERGMDMDNGAVSQSGQALHTREWVYEHRDANPVSKDSFEVVMDRIGKTLIVLAIVLGIAVLVVQGYKLLG